MTVITYKHLQLIDRQTKKPPVLVGPMLIHQKKPWNHITFLHLELSAYVHSLNPQWHLLQMERRQLVMLFTHSSLTQSTYFVLSMCVIVFLPN